MTRKDIYRNLRAGSKVHVIFPIKGMPRYYLNVKGTDFKITESQRRHIDHVIELEGTDQNDRRHIYKYRQL